MKSYEASCICGSIKYRFTGKPYTIYACHCTDCQRRTGTAFGLSMHVPASSVELTEGNHLDITKPDGSIFKLCEGCRSCILFRFSPDKYCIFPGHFDDNSWFKPVANIWTRSAQPWVYIDKSLKSYEQEPDWSELYRLYEQAS